MNVRARAALLSATALALVLCASVASAQALLESPLSIRTTIAAPSGEHVGPTRNALSVAVRTAIPATTSSPQANNAGLGQNQALMIVGGAAILVGAIVGGDAGTFFMVGGAVVGLYGLYKYLQ